MGWRPRSDRFDDPGDAPVLKRVVNTPTPPAPPDVVEEETGGGMPAPPVSATSRCQLCGGPLGYGDVASPLRCVECGQEPPVIARTDWGAA